MSSQPPNARFRRAVRGFYAWIGSLIFAGGGAVLASRLIDTGTITGRIAGVALSAVAWIPLAVVITWIIRAGDEFQQRQHLVALAFSFASALLLLTLLDSLVRAEFMGPPPLGALWLAFAVMWLIWIFIVKYCFERES